MSDGETATRETPAKITIRLEPKLHARLRAMSQRERRSLHAQVVRYVEQGLEREEATQANSNP